MENDLGPDHPDVATMLNSLASLYFIQAKYAEAEESYKRTLEIYEKALGADHLSVAVVLKNMASLYRNTAKEIQADKLEEQQKKFEEKINNRI